MTSPVDGLPTRNVLLATFCLCPEGEPGGEALLEALAARGVDAAWAVWDDPSVDWAGADLVAVRATWDYHRRWAPFRAWVEAVEKHTTVLNGGGVFDWNHDKAYLLELGKQVPVVPSLSVADDDLLGGVVEALGRWGTIVVKPRVGASGVGVVVAEVTDDLRLAGLTTGPWLAQPLVESVRTRGESSVVVMGGRPVVQVDKRPAAGEVRVHEEYGGTMAAVPVDAAAGELSLAAVSAAEAILGQSLDYARVDLMEIDGSLVVGELELIEPGFYLDVAPSAAEDFAQIVVERVR